MGLVGLQLRPGQIYRQAASRAARATPRSCSPTCTGPHAFQASGQAAAAICSASSVPVSRPRAFQTTKASRQRNSAGFGGKTSVKKEENHRGKGASYPHFAAKKPLGKVIAPANQCGADLEPAGAEPPGRAQCETTRPANAGR